MRQPLSFLARLTSMAICCLVFFAGCGKSEKTSAVAPTSGGPTAAGTAGDTGTSGSQAKSTQASDWTQSPADGSSAPTFPAADPAFPSGAPNFSPDIGSNPPAGHNQEQQPSPTQQEPPVNEARAVAAGLRVLKGQHLTLYTDVSSTPEVDELPHVFDLAVALWCRYFGIDEQQVSQWKMFAYLIDRKEPFQALDLLRPNLPPFQNGYQQGSEIWVYEQDGDYYRRHLLLHEGTHAFMNWFLGGAGPPWYMEGTAELLGTHKWNGKQLTLAYFPQDRADVPLWGRVKIVRDGFKQAAALQLDDIFRYGPRAHLMVEPYGWCWAACAFLDGHPAYQERFRMLNQSVGDEAAFSQKRDELFKQDWARLREEWQLYVASLDYGYDIARNAITYHEQFPVTPEDGATFQLRTDRGWQSTGWLLNAGEPCTISATGSYELGQSPRPWPCQANGVTIRYEQGKPLGILMGAIRPESASGTITALANSGVVGSQRTITPKESGVLFLKVNDNPAELADNRGELTITFKRN